MSQEKRPYLTGCPVGCDAGTEITNVVLPEGPLLRCKACGQYFSQCDEEWYWRSMERFDDPQGTLPNARSIARRFRRSKQFLDWIATHLAVTPPDIRLLDVGCSSGAFLRSAVELGYRAEGVEPAPQAVETAAAAGLNVRCGLLQDIGYADGQFDAITLLEVIEHLKDPVNLLRECHRILRPGGIMMIGTGNADSWSMAAMGARWEYLHIDRLGGHISFYSPHSMQVLAGKAGFQVVGVHTRGVRFYEKGDCGNLTYRLAKITGELLNPLAVALNKGHDMAVYLRRD